MGAPAFFCLPPLLQKGITMNEDSKPMLGDRGKRAAVAFLENRGLEILETGWSCSYGTVDAIAMDGEALVFVQVKTRKASASGIPEENVTPAMQRKFTKMAKLYVKRSDVEHESVRFDIIAIYAFSGTQALLRYIRGAFDAVDADTTKPPFNPGYEPECDGCDSQVTETDENGTSHDCSASDCLERMDAEGELK